MKYRYIFPHPDDESFGTAAIIPSQLPGGRLHFELYAEDFDPPVRDLAEGMEG